VKAYRETLYHYIRGLKMKSIKYDASNTDKINAILAEVNGRAGDHIYCNYQDFAPAANAKIAEVKNLVGGEKYTVGIKISIESGGSVSKSYKYTRIGTRIALERKASGWFVTEIKRIDIWAKGGESKIVLTPAHHDRAVNVLKSGYFVTNTIAN
jgi:hypothetical protein